MLTSLPLSDTHHSGPYPTVYSPRPCADLLAPAQFPVNLLIPTLTSDSHQPCHLQPSAEPPCQPHDPWQTYPHCVDPTTPSLVPCPPDAHPTPCTDPPVLSAVCDHCVVLLLDDLERAGALLPAIREQLHGVNASSAAWARLHRLNASIADLQVPLGPAPQPLSPVTGPHLPLPTEPAAEPPGPPP